MSSSLLLSNWLDEVADELREQLLQRETTTTNLEQQQQQQQQGGGGGDENNKEEEQYLLTQAEMDEYVEVERLCPFNLEELVFGSDDEEEEEEERTSGEQKLQLTLKAAVVPQSLSHDFLHTTAAQSTASKQTSNATTTDVASHTTSSPQFKCTVAGTPDRTTRSRSGLVHQPRTTLSQTHQTQTLSSHPRLIVFTPDILGEEVEDGDDENSNATSIGDDEEVEEGNRQSNGGLSPDFRSRKSSTTAGAATAPTTPPIFGCFAQLNPSNLDFVSRKAYYSPSASTSAQQHYSCCPSNMPSPSSHHGGGGGTATAGGAGSPSLLTTAASSVAGSPRRRCWVDLPEETTALFEGSVTCGRLQRTNTSIKYPLNVATAATATTTNSTPTHLQRSTGGLTPAPELRLGEPVVKVTTTAAAEVTVLDVTDEDNDDEEGDVVQVVSWLDAIDEEEAEKRELPTAVAANGNGGEVFCHITFPKGINKTNKEVEQAAAAAAEAQAESGGMHLLSAGEEAAEEPPVPMATCCDHQSSGGSAASRQYSCSDQAFRKVSSSTFSSSNHGSFAAAAAC